MHTVTVDSRKRVRLPDSKPGQVFAYETEGEAIHLLPVKTETKERFPRGSLTKFFTGAAGKERDELELALLKGCVQGPIEE